jgi:hypothetical protein
MTAPVAQGIEHRFPKPCAQVRILPGALNDLNPFERVDVLSGSAHRSKPLALFLRCLRPPHDGIDALKIFFLYSNPQFFT